eukprot:TRINITY_DN3402_c0_g1_i1.p1 TRINITY_DN3402_c0_g1~~TRINITY_DN3402_c0_g1_i1.p1  ORF type:complete len:740 (-),score=120.53 TRINITY_DN3402_c0_g1_i1:90-2309(-)
MAGIDDNVTVIGDWAPPDPSPRTFFSTFLGDSYGSSRSFSDLLTESGNEEPLTGHETQKDKENTDDEKGEFGGGDFGNHSITSSALTGQKTGSRRGLAERMAGRAGFNDLRLNTARIRSANMSSEVRSPYLTIPPGLSPTTLLDSPVFLSNSLAQQSPTTGKFPFAPNNNKSLMSTSATVDKNDDHMLEDVDTASFVFKPHIESRSSYFPTAANKVAASTNNHQSLPSIEVSVQSEHPMHSASLDTTVVHSQNQQKFHFQADLPEPSVGKDNTSNPRALDGIVCNANSTPGITSEYSPPPGDQQDGDQRGEFTAMVGSTSSEDGYNWRKYGQKQVKGSEFPRSYYKCTHPNCQVKKKVEQSHEGHITEIIYKGAHSHPKPPPNRRSAVGSSQLLNDMDIPEHHGLRDRVDGDSTWASTQQGAIIGGPDRRHDGPEAVSFATLTAGFCDPSTSMQTQDGLHFESGDAIEVSSTLSNGEDEDEQGTHGSMSMGGDGDGDESESKRRKLDACAMEMSGATRPVREPRVVVQTTSEVDILDDGYRWRKYGQKVVKGNPNPRSYYKCTNAGCTVRKHVERASHDLKSVITTYEGKHNHDVPAARNSSHISTGSSGMAPATAAQTYMHKPEPSQIHDSLARYDGPTSLGGTFGMAGRQQLGTAPGFSFGMGQQGLANLAMAGLGPGQGKMSVMPVHSYLGQRQAGFMMPKGEPKEEPVSDSGLSSKGSSVYHQIMNRGLPLGPQL